MACWVLVTMAAGLSGAPVDSEASAVNRDYLSVMIPIRPAATSPIARARTTILTTRGASFAVVESREDILAMPCGKERRAPPD